MAVVATAGTTATGSFDDLEAIGRLCEAHDVWLHVDGAHGASALLSPTHRARVAGIHRARSIAWDPHKMMLMPLAASVVLVRDERDLQAAFAQQRAVPVPRGPGERRLGSGAAQLPVLATARRLKVWVALQRHGAAGFAALYDHLCATAHAPARGDTRAPGVRGAARARREHRLLPLRQATVPCRTRNWTPSITRLRETYNRDGDGWITTTVLGGRRVLRATVMNPRTTADDVVRVLDRLSALAG